jgi:hypothetical protein
MAHIKIHALYRNNEPGHDKIWGYCYMPDSGQMMPRRHQPVFVFYGATGRAFQVKQHQMGDQLIDLERSKRRRDYKQIPSESIGDFYANFQDDLERKLTFVILGDDKYASIK